MRALNWSTSPLGEPDTWPLALKHALGIMMSQSAQICIFWGTELVALYNDAYRPAIGNNHPRALGRPAQENWAELWDELEPLLRGVYETGRAFESKNHHFRVNRLGFMEDIYFDVSYGPIADGDGKIGGVFCIVHDQTSRMIDDRRLRTLRELTLHTSTADIEQAARTALEIVARENDADIPYALLYLNPPRSRRLRLVASFGAAPVGEAFEIDLHSNTATFARQLAGVLEKERAEAFEDFSLLAERSTAASTRTVVLPLRIGGHVGGLLIAGKNALIPPTDEYRRFMELLAGQVATAMTTAKTLHDERHRAEELQRQVASTLKERAAAEAQLRQSQKMESIGKLTGGVAHDFNNLLQVISGNLQLLGKTVQGDKRAERWIENALAGVTRGSKLASQLLAFARRQPLEPRAVNPGRLIQGLDEMLRRALGEEIEIETVIAGGLWNTMVDPGQVENALLNLAINARDAMDGVGRLTIEAGNAYLDDAYVAFHTEVEAGQYVAIAVTDTGSGMTAEVIERAFDPFFTTKSEGRGTGLGLSMVYGFVKQSGGHIKIYSELGLGTTVKLYLPRSHQSEDQPVEMEAGVAIGGTETVLVVEDDAAVRTTVVETLTDLGYRVLKAKDAAAALAIIESGVAIDLLFTDVVMPGALRSPELARKARDRLPNLAVLFTSGCTENAIVHGGRLDPGVNLLSKPYSREALARKFRHVLANQKQRQMARSSLEGERPSLPADLPRSLPARRILLVEDDGLIRLNTLELLEELGMQVAAAASVEEALELLKAQPFDILLTDVTLPDATGTELADRAIQFQPQLEIVFATGHDLVLDPPAGLAIRPRLLRKPYGQADLIQCLLPEVSLRTD